jgi:predicted kinase
MMEYWINKTGRVDGCFLRSSSFPMFHHSSIPVFSGVGGVPMERDFVEVIQTEIPADSVLITVGLPGSWKSPVTEEIARLKGFQILRSDLIRLEVLKGLDIFDNRVASSPENRGKVYQEMFRRAEEALKPSSGGVILDATFFTQDLRLEAAAIAHRAGRAFVIAECACSEERSIQRILKRTKEHYESNALTRDAYLNNKALFQPVSVRGITEKFAALPVIHLTIDTEEDTLADWKIRDVVKG